jgi:uncharacterized protein YjdB
MEKGGFMKTRIKKGISLLLALAMILTSVTIMPTQAQAATKISISETSRTLIQKEKFRLYLKGTTSNAKWSSSDTKIATVNSKSGMVTAKKAGTCTISGKLKGKKYQCEVTVVQYMDGKDVTLADTLAGSIAHLGGMLYNEDSVDVLAIQLGKFVVDIEESRNYSVHEYDAHIKFSFLDKNKQTMTAHSCLNIASGYSYTMIDSENGQGLKSSTVSSEITGTEFEQIKKLASLIKAGKYDTDADDGTVKLSRNALTLAKGSSKTLKVKNTTAKVSWGTSNKKVATVSKGGKVTAKKQGKATITATVEGKKYKCSLIVLPSLSKNEKNILQCLYSTYRNMTYPQSLKIVSIEEGTYPAMTRDDGDTVFKTVTSYFAKITVDIKFNDSTTRRIVLLPGYYENSSNYEWTWVLNSDAGSYQNTSGSVKKCSAATIKKYQSWATDGKTIANLPD